VRALLLVPLLAFDGLGDGGHFGLGHRLGVRVLIRHLVRFADQILALSAVTTYKCRPLTLDDYNHAPPRFFEMTTTPSVLQSGSQEYR
jgi:hypothetical protein